MLLRRLRGRLTEATASDALLAGTGIDPDEHLYRRLTSDRGDTLPAHQQERMQAVARHLYLTNPVGHRLITLLTDFVLGEGVTYTCQNSAVEAVIAAHWADPYNQAALYQPQAMADAYATYLLYGELLLPLFPNLADGHLRLGCVPVDRIRAIEPDPENWRILRAAVLRPQQVGGDDLRYTLVNVREGPEAVLSAERPALFWRRLNPFGTRGLSLLYPVADLIDLLDQFVFSEVERWFLLKAFVWDVTVVDATEERIAALARTEAFRVPRPGEVRLHNEKISWQPLAPALETYDAANGWRSLRNHILGALGIPEHWWSEGGEVNRAVGETMAEVPRKRFTLLQQEWRDVLETVLRAQVDAAVAAGTLPAEVVVERDGQPTAARLPARETVAVSMPELSGDDEAQTATTLEVLGRALALSSSEGLISEETARRAYLAVASKLGVTVGYDEEVARIAQDAAQRAPQGQRPPAELATLPPRGQRADDTAAG